MTETELEELDVLLSSVEGVSASLPVDGLHGFLTALVMSGGGEAASRTDLAVDSQADAGFATGSRSCP